MFWVLRCENGQRIILSLKNNSSLKKFSMFS